MGNVIGYDRRPDLGVLEMSNGLTSVVMSTLALALSAIAQTDRQRELAVWFAAHDQAVFGLGVVGFDVSALPWRTETFEDDRAFVLAAVDAARAKTGWDRLAYTPREDSTLGCLAQFGRLIASFDVADRDAKPESIWAFGDPPHSFESCSEHAVYCHSGGCIVCNDR